MGGKISRIKKKNIAGRNHIKTLQEALILALIDGGIKRKGKVIFDPAQS